MAMNLISQKGNQGSAMSMGRVIGGGQRQGPGQTGSGQDAVLLSSYVLNGLEQGSFPPDVSVLGDFLYSMLLPQRKKKDARSLDSGSILPGNRGAQYGETVGKDESGMIFSERI